MLQLNVGCGEFAAPHPWVNIDSYGGPEVAADVVADGRDLPYDDGAAELVYLGHVIEHLPPEDAPALLAEAFRVLAPGGRVMVVAPDRKRLEATGNPGLIAHNSAGACRWEGDEHQWVPTSAEVAVELAAAGFADVTELDPLDVPRVWPIVSRIGWQLAVSGTKPQEEQA